MKGVKNGMLLIMFAVLCLISVLIASAISNDLYKGLLFLGILPAIAMAYGNPKDKELPLSLFCAATAGQGAVVWLLGNWVVAVFILLPGVLGVLTETGYTYLRKRG